MHQKNPINLKGTEEEEGKDRLVNSLKHILYMILFGVLYCSEGLSCDTVRDVRALMQVLDWSYCNWESWFHYHHYQHISHCALEL